MDFIETVLGISPDGGSGAAEMTFILVPILVLAYFFAPLLRRFVYPNIKKQKSWVRNGPSAQNTHE